MPPLPTPIYHITSIRNLPSIVAEGGMRSYNKMKELKVSNINIAHQTIQDRRATKKVTCGPGGTLHDYIPFYFASRSPMLYAISRGNVAGYIEGQKPIVHLVSSVQIVQQAEAKFVFTDGHGIVAFTQFYDDIHYLDEVDWEIIKARSWFDTDIFNDRKRRKQAEFLVYDFFPWSLITEIGVISLEVKNQVERILDNVAHQPPVIVRPDWYY